MHKIVTLIILVLLPYLALAQVLEGAIIDKDAKTTIPGVTVINRQSGVIVFSDADGRYSIHAEAGDTVVFRHTAYEQVHEVMVYTMGSRYKTIIMTPVVYKLNETTITVLTKYQQDLVERHEAYNHELTKTIVAPPKYTGLGCSGCFGWIADKITGNSKKPKRFRKQFAKDDEAMFIDSRYTPELVTSLTGQKDTDSIAAFIYAYPMEYAFARTASDLEMKAWIRNNYREFIKNGAAIKATEQ